MEVRRLSVDAGGAQSVGSCSSAPLLVRDFVWGDPERYPEVVAMQTYTIYFPEPEDPPVSVPSAAYHNLHDVLGSVIGLVDDAGELVERYTYDPYGKVFIEKWDATANGGAGAWATSETDCGSSTCGKLPVSSVGNPFLWTGHRYDAAVGLYATLYRTYSPTLGRWLQRDPIEYAGGSLNLYEYLTSSPLSGIDPLGLLYGPETHDRGTRDAAKGQGFSECEAKKIADCNQGEDENGCDAVTQGVIIFLTAGLCGDKQKYDDHFPGAGPPLPFRKQSPVEPGFRNEGVSQRILDAIASCDLCSFGKALHTLQDSYSHAGQPDFGGHPKGRCYDDSGPGSKPVMLLEIIPLCRSRQGTSQGLFDKGVDDPANDRERHRKAMRDTELAMLLFKSNCDKKDKNKECCK